MKIVLTVLAVIGFILFFLIFCPVCIKLTYREEIQLRIGYLFPVFRILPMKEKPEKQSAKESGKQKNTDEEKKKEGTPKKENPLVKYKNKHGVGGLIELFKNLASVLLKASKMITGNLVISKLDLNLIYVGEDAAETAITFGELCGVIFPLVNVIEQNVKQCRHHINIQAGFTAEKTQINMVVKARIIPVFVLIAGVYALIKALRQLAN